MATADNLADIFTKPLGKATFVRLRALVLGLELAIVNEAVRSAAPAGKPQTGAKKRGGKKNGKGRKRLPELDVAGAFHNAKVDTSRLQHSGHAYGLKSAAARS